MRKPVRRIVSLLLLLCATSFLFQSPHQLIAQEDEAAPVRTFFPTADRKLIQALTRAKKAIQEERYDEALSDLGFLVATDPQSVADSDQILAEDYFLTGRGREPGMSLKTEAMQLLARVPSKAMRQYELKHGAEAQAMLEQALRQASAEKLAEVTRRFFHTEAGYAACLALGRFQLEQGRPLYAATLLKRIVETPAAASLEPEAAVLLAAAWLHSGHADLAKQTLITLKQARPQLAIRSGEANVPIFKDEADALPWLEKLFGGPAESSAQGAKIDWTMFRGSPDRNASVDFGEPVAAFRWQVPVVNDPTDGNIVSELARQHDQLRTPSLPAIHPLIVKDVVIARSADNKLFGVNLKSGKRFWVYPEDHSPRAYFKPRDPKSAPLSRAAELRVRIWENQVFGQVSSDGERVFVVEESEPDANRIDPINDDPFRARPLNQEPPTNLLTALSLKREGAKLWTAGYNNSELEKTFFLGPPTPAEGELFSIVEKAGAISLVSLDPATGKVVWKQKLVHVENTSIAMDPLRRNAGAMASYADGVLVCPTSAGAVVGVDLATRRLLWAHPYPRGEGGGRRFQSDPFISPRMLSSRYGERWADSAPTIADGRVVITPADSGELFCADLLTGKLAWPAQRRDDTYFVAGIRHGMIVLVSAKSISAISLSDGKEAWNEAIDLDEDLPSGRGVLDADHYYQPLASGTLLVVDIAKGKVVKSTKTDRPLGNLVAYKDDVISLSHEHLAAYHRADRLETRVETALLADPNDSWALARQGQLFLLAGKPDEAFASIRKALAQPKPDPSAQSLFVGTSLVLLERDFLKHQSLVEDVARYIDDPSMLNRYHRVVASGREKLGEPLAAFKSYVALSRAQLSQASVLHDSYCDVDRQWRVQQANWILARLATLYRQANDKERLAMDRLVEETRRGIADESPQILRRFVERFAFHPVARQAKVELAQLLAAAGNRLEAEGLLRPLMKSEDRQIAAEATLVQATMLTSAGRWSDALVCYQKLNDQFGDVKLGSGRTGKQAVMAAASSTDYQSALNASQRIFPRGKVLVESDTRSTLRNVSVRNMPVTLLQADVDGNSVPQIFYEQQGYESIRVRDSLGIEQSRISLRRRDSRRFYYNTGISTGRIAGHLLVVSTGHEIIGIDLLRSGNSDDAILWRHDVAEPGDNNGYNVMQSREAKNPWSTVGRSVVADVQNRPLGLTSAITASGICFLRQGQLVCVDPYSGDVKWQRSDIEPGSDFFGDEEYLFVIAHGQEDATLYRMVDGEKVGARSTKKFERRWTACGSNVLWFHQHTNPKVKSEQLELQLDNVIDDKQVWRETAGAGAKAWLCAPDEVAILALDGRFKIRSLKSDEVLLDLQLEPEKSLLQLIVLKGRDQYIVAVSVDPSTPSRDQNFQPAPGGASCVKLTGKIYAIDRATKKLAWPAPAAISEMGFPYDQAVDQPLLIFMRNLPRPNKPGTTFLMCLDKRTGALVYEDAEIESPTTVYELQADRETPSVRLAVQGKSYRLRFTDQPAPPEPPVQHDYAMRKKKLGGIFDLFQSSRPVPEFVPEEDDDPFR